MTLDHDNVTDELRSIERICDIVAPLEPYVRFRVLHYALEVACGCKPLMVAGVMPYVPKEADREAKETDHA